MKAYILQFQNINRKKNKIEKKRTLYFITVCIDCFVFLQKEKKEKKKLNNGIYFDIFRH